MKGPAVVAYGKNYVTGVEKGRAEVHVVDVSTHGPSALAEDSGQYLLFGFGAGFRFQGTQHEAPDRGIGIRLAAAGSGHTFHFEVDESTAASVAVARNFALNECELFHDSILPADRVGLVDLAQKSVNSL